jgi:6-pyruvoyltetrahydropterin/6-carboxytetrahydropterin synthase
MHISHKIYGHERGLSCCFRQPTADSHCRFLHGYALSVSLEFHAEQLDGRNWVMDFGGLKEIENWLKSMFDHTLLVAMDDPMLELFKTMHKAGLADVRILKHVGCEAFSHMIFEYVDAWLQDRQDVPNRVWLHKVGVCEHGSNGAGYVRD